MWLVLCMFDLYLITDSCIVQNFLNQLFSVFCVNCGIIFSLSFTLIVDCVLSITGTGIGMLLFFCCRGWLDKVLIIVPVAIGYFYSVFML